nr:CGNR zinc finger domain-containing protein [Mycoplana dimorpha]
MRRCSLPALAAASGWLFFDQSRNGRRRWCSDKKCGSNARVRKFRAVRAD